MLPVATTTTPIPIQPTLVATPLPGNYTARVSAAAVPPSVSNSAVANNSKGNGAPVSPQAEVAPTAQTIAPPLSTTIPASLSTSAASLGASAMFAAQALAQGAPAQEFMAAYEEMVSISEVKYRPSNATRPEPAPSNVFSKILREEHIRQAPQAQTNAKLASQLAEVPVANYVATIPVVPKASEAKPATGKRAEQETSRTLSEGNEQAYQATAIRNIIHSEGFTEDTKA